MKNVQAHKGHSAQINGYYQSYPADNKFRPRSFVTAWFIDHLSNVWLLIRGIDAGVQFGAVLLQQY